MSARSWNVCAATSPARRCRKKRLSLLSDGNVRYELKTPYRDGTTHVIFQPLDFIARLVVLVPKPRVNLARFHGVFAPNSAHRGAARKAGQREWLLSLADLTIN